MIQPGCRQIDTAASPVTNPASDGKSLAVFEIRRTAPTRCRLRACLTMGLQQSGWLARGLRPASGPLASSLPVRGAARTPPRHCQREALDEALEGVREGLAAPRGGRTSSVDGLEEQPGRFNAAGRLGFPGPRRATPRRRLQNSPPTRRRRKSPCAGPFRAYGAGWRLPSPLEGGGPQGIAGCLRPGWPSGRWFCWVPWGGSPSLPRHRPTGECRCSSRHRLEADQSPRCSSSRQYPDVALLAKSPGATSLPR